MKFQILYKINIVRWIVKMVHKTVEDGQNSVPRPLGFVIKHQRASHEGMPFDVGCGGRTVERHLPRRRERDGFIGWANAETFTARAAKLGSSPSGFVIKRQRASREGMPFDIGI